MNVKNSDLKALSDALKELNESYNDFMCSMMDTVRGVKTAKKLWHDGQKPWLIKLGLALLVFPEPIISDILGSLLIAAGTVREGIRRHTLHIEDVPKTFKYVLKELKASQESISLASGLG